MILSHDARREWRSFAADRRRKRCAAPFVPAEFPDTGVAPNTTFRSDLGAGAGAGAAGAAAAAAAAAARGGGVRRGSVPRGLSAPTQSYSTPQKRHRTCSGITDAPPPPAPPAGLEIFDLLSDSDFAMRLRADIVAENGVDADLPDAGAWTEAVRAVADSLRQDPAARRQFMVGIDAPTIRGYAAAATVLGGDDGEEMGKSGALGAGSVVGGARDAGEGAGLPPPTVPRAQCPPHRAPHAFSPASPASVVASTSFSSPSSVSCSSSPAPASYSSSSSSSSSCSPPRQLTGRSADWTHTTGGGSHTGKLGETGRGWRTAENEAEDAQGTQDGQDAKEDGQWHVGRPVTPTFEELMAESTMAAVGGRGGKRGERAR